MKKKAAAKKANALITRRRTLTLWRKAVRLGGGPHVECASNNQDWDSCDLNCDLNRSGEFGGALVAFAALVHEQKP